MAVGVRSELPLKCPWCNEIIVAAGEAPPHAGVWQKCPHCDLKIEAVQCSYDDHPCGVVFRVIPSATAQSGQGLDRNQPYFPAPLIGAQDVVGARALCNLLHRGQRP